MHAIWQGTISFGLVNIPVSLYSGSVTHAGIDLDMLHKKDHSPIRFARICRHDGKEVPYEDIIKGYQYSKGEYIEITEEDFKNTNAKKSSTIEIKQFVDSSEIDIRYFEKPYYLEPEKGGEMAYALLREALVDSKKAALCKYVLRNRESIGVLKPVSNAIVLNQMRFPTDIRDPHELKFPPKSKVDPAQIKIAMTLINKLEGHFIPEDWHDTYTEELEDTIAQKLKGKKVKSKSAKSEPTEVKDLMKSLKASLEK